MNDFADWRTLLGWWKGAK